MITLLNGCYCSEPAVFPKNWQNTGASCKKNWFIHYRFYDPNFKDHQGKIKPFPVRIKGMNKFKLLVERRAVTAALLKEELHLLKVDGYNYHSKTFMSPPVNNDPGEISGNTLFIPALERSLERLNVVKDVSDDITGIIKKLDAAAIQLRYQNMKVSEISRRHIKFLLDQCGKNSDKFSNNRYNTYRGYLMMLFKELVEIEACLINPTWGISKKPVTKKVKVVLTNEQRNKVDEHLKKVFPRFREFVHLFFHSGGRKTELLQLKPGMVDLKNQKYRCVIKKRKSYQEVDRTIKTIAIPFWEYFLQDCPDDHFLFGTLFMPSTKPIGVEMPTQYWLKHVKKALGINVDFYALKHLNTTETVDALDERAAAEQNGQTSAAMVVQIYDTRQEERVHNRLKGVNNDFVKSI